MECVHGIDQVQVRYGVEEAHDVIGQHCHHFVVVPSCFYIIHHSEEGILG